MSTSKQTTGEPINWSNVAKGIIAILGAIGVGATVVGSNSGSDCISAERMAHHEEIQKAKWENQIELNKSFNATLLEIRDELKSHREILIRIDERERRRSR